MPLETEPIASDPETQLAYASILITSSRLGVFDHEDGLKHLFPVNNRSHHQHLFPKKKRERHIYVNTDPNSPNRYPHPYQLELEQYRYPSSVYTHSEPIMYKPFDSTTATFVEDEEALVEMLEELKHAKEIAIDLEHHDNRSYIGIVSLMQISTREKDWIVDTLKPWRRKLQCLNEVFADPSIIKVLHGAFMDVMWLQRDLGLYLVGLFDTHYAARALGYQGGSLAFLLKKFIDFDAQKQYQMADWRVRPLPQELFDYARSDTHFLLYIFDCMRNELIERSYFDAPDHEGDKIWDVLQKSTETALQRYEHPIYDVESGQGPMGWYRLLSRTPALLDKQQFAVFRAVHKWRDNVAREQDDSIHYIMPNHQIFTIAKAMSPTRLALFGIAQPVTQTVKLRVDELVSIIAKAKADGNDGPDMAETMNRLDPRKYDRVSPDAQPVPVKQVKVATPAPVPAAVNGMSSTLPLRSTNSAFWGSAFEGSSYQKRAASSRADISLAVPLPPLTAEIFADPSEAMAADNEPPSSEPASAEELQEEPDDTFVLKDFSKKRKRADPFDGMAANTDEVNLNGPSPEETRLREKAERKAAKKEAKRAAKAAGSGEIDSAAEGEVEDDTPFDYSAAPSILNPPRESKESAKERRKREKQLNPYAKSLDAPKGLPRNQKEKAGKSKTFRN